MLTLTVCHTHDIIFMDYLEKSKVVTGSIIIIENNRLIKNYIGSKSLLHENYIITAYVGFGGIKYERIVGVCIYVYIVYIVGYIHITLRYYVLLFRNCCNCKKETNVKSQKL